MPTLRRLFLRVTTASLFLASTTGVVREKASAQTAGRAIDVSCPARPPMTHAPVDGDTAPANACVPTDDLGSIGTMKFPSGARTGRHSLKMAEACPSASTASEEAHSNLPGYDIIIVGGQSNASNSGVGPRLDPLVGVVDDRIFQAICDDPNGKGTLDSAESSQIVSAFDYVHDCLSGNPAYTKTILQSHRSGFAISFARQYSLRNLHTARKTLIVAGGVPGSIATDWIAGPNAHLPNLLSRARAALALPGHNRVVAFAWSQGEAEIAYVGEALAKGALEPAQYGRYLDDYADRVMQIIATARGALGTPKLPFLISDYPPEWTVYQDVKTDFQKLNGRIAAHSGFAATVPTSGLTSNPLCLGSPVDAFDCEDAARIHFSAQSHVDLGARFFRTLRLLQGST